ncbi:colicin E3/pyocin S6 family cytotoxin, partial [Saccharospirillum impatiens]|uniref:colicin E3/pyocin S6 family cytotoxin n=1 Tax=Saccharospirillum impatiens TaxID=169438 RepID=UPI001FDEC740
DLSPLELVAYNYTVEDYETYFVGEFGLWVHNVCNTSSANARRANPSKSESEVWNSSQSVGNGRRSNGERGRNREYYEWDHTHNDIEVYDYRGQHKGSKDPVTGEMYKDAVEGRTIDI